MTLHYLLLSISLIISGTAFGRIDATLTDPQIICVINGQKIPTAAVNALQKIVSQREPNIKQAELLDGIIQNRLLAEHVFNHLSIKEKQQVESATAIEWQAILNKLLPFPVPVMPKTYILAAFPISQRDLQAVFPRPTVKHLRLRAFVVTVEQKQKAQQITLLTYQFPKQNKQSISLWDIYPTGIHAQHAFHQHDTLSINKILQSQLQQRYVRYLIANQSSLTEFDRSVLRVFIRDKQIKLAYAKKIGAFSALHLANPAISKVAKSISDAEINAYYQAHTSQFKQVSNVHAKHIVLPSQKQADHIYQLLQQGLDFNQAIKKYSISQDKHAAIPGDLGSIDTKNKQLSFSQKTALLFQPNQVSRPFRSQSGWEIFLVRTRKEVLLAKTDKSVRYEISRTLARKKIANKFSKLINQLSENASIQVHHVK